LMLGTAGANGSVAFEGTVRSEVLSSNRFYRVYLPPEYTSASARYPVLYVHDGQNAFTTAGPHAAFGWGNWALDHTATRLITSKKIRPIIIVAIDCSASRYREYRGPVPAGQDNKAYDRYARFLIQELRPKIDRDYRTLSDAAHTGLLGSSMGGIASLALAWEHPHIFGLAASLSGAFQVEKQFFADKILAHYTNRPKPIRIYLDSGITDYTGGDDGARQTATVARHLERIGWQPGTNLLHFVDQPLTAAELEPHGLDQGKFAEAQRSQHNEFYWRLRAWRALTFLFPPPDQADSTP
jgi:predicted alpha/beta superfamily hydrolase